MSKKSLLLNRTLLIKLVRERPAIWDQTMNIYKCKRAKVEAWRDICLALNKEYESTEPNQRKFYFKQLIRTWTHIRDSWMRSMKDNRNRKDLTRPYIYHQQLQFLKKILLPRDDSETTDNTDEIEHQEDVEDEREQEKAGTSGFSMEIQEMIEDKSQIEVTKKSLIINRAQLINLVRDKLAIWDKTADVYKNKHAKADAWREICLVMNEYYEQMNQSKRKEYFKLLISIWTQVRDTWMRSVKNKLCRPYKHHKKMLFLKKIINSAEVLDNIENMGDNEQDTENDEENENNSVDTSCSSMRRQNADEDNRECTYFVDWQTKNMPCQTETEDRNYSFFKSIQPTLAFFNDDQILQFQAGTINLLQKIKMGQNFNEFQQHRPSHAGASRMSEEVPLPLNPDPIKIETYDIT